jgi:hypothetical protein
MRPVRKADNLTNLVKKSGNLNFLELSGPPQACNGTALPLHYRETDSIHFCNQPGFVSVDT